MTNEYVLATNDDGDLAIRTVSATEASDITDTLSVITRTDDGKLAVRTVGSGGGDQHNLGYYATLAELQEAYPTGEAGDWAIVAESDTVYIWDDTQQAWVDTDQKGQVTSVNGQTGDVVLDLLPDQTGNAGKFLTTDGTDASWGTELTNELVIRRSGTTETCLRLHNGSSNVSLWADGRGLYMNNGLTTVGNILPGLSGYALGSSIQKWVLYATKLKNGADIAVPTTGGTMAVISVNTTVTLAAANWSSNTQTVTVSGVKADSVVFVSPAPASASDYASAGILCTAQAADSLTFSCATTPSNTITVNVVCM